MPTRQKDKGLSSSDKLSLTQTIVLTLTLIITIIVSYRNDSAQANRDSGEFMLKFDERFDAEPGGIIARTLYRDGNLDNLHIGKMRLQDGLGDFFGNYELLNEAYTHKLINDDMSFDAFDYVLEKALQDKTARDYLILSRAEDGDIYSGVISLAAIWKIHYPPLNNSVSAK